MKIEVFDDQKILHRRAALVIAAELTTKSAPVLGLATGGTPVATYQELIRLHREEGLSFAHVRSFNLDEYVGISYEHPESYHAFMKRQLFDSVDIPDDAWQVPDPNNSEMLARPSLYDELIEAAGGIDLQLLGLGNNGHVAFNEPADSFSEWTTRVALTESTILANSRFFDSPDEVPREALSMGIASIMRARKILLLACGESKAKAVKAMVQGEISAQCPASVLRLHRDVTILLDRDAAMLLEA
ncbi:MAG: glucosamine-6-phosphate deaminase [Eubacteriales bacterium]|nr:glucosamine-6-phosphate deaminase [Eubacteriales bacterium]